MFKNIYFLKKNVNSKIEKISKKILKSKKNMLPSGTCPILPGALRVLLPGNKKKPADAG